MQTKRIANIAGTGVAVRGNDLDTDRIVPARYLKEVTFDHMGEYPFIDERFDERGNPRPHPFNDPRYRAASILFVNDNFGCGSSREHATWALRDFGFKAIIAPSFADIFRANSYKTGLLAVTLPDSQVRHLVDLVSEDPAVEVVVDLEAQAVRGDGFSYRFEIDPFARECLLGGLDEIALVERHEPDIAAYEKARADWLPAVR